MGRVRKNTTRQEHATETRASVQVRSMTLQGASDCRPSHQIPIRNLCIANKPLPKIKLTTNGELPAQKFGTLKQNQSFPHTSDISHHGMGVRLLTTNQKHVFAARQPQSLSDVWLQKYASGWL